MKKKFICMILATVMIFSLAACGNAAPADNSNTTEAAEAAETTETTETAEEDIAPVEENETPTDEVAQPENEALILNAPITIYDEGDVAITVNPIENNKFNMTIANNSAADVNLKYDFICINGYQVNDTQATHTEAGASKDCIITLDSFFEALGSDEVASVELQAKLYDYASSTEIADLGNIFIQGEAYGKDVPDLVTDEAMLVYSDDKVLAYIDPTFITTEVDFSLRGFTVNNTDAPIWCSAENFAFNGTPYDGLGDFETAAGLRKFDKIIDQFYYSWIGVEKADDIQTIEFDYTIGATTVHVTLTNNAGSLSVESIN